jgi:hypothetical protein
MDMAAWKDWLCVKLVCAHFNGDGFGDILPMRDAQATERGLRFFGAVSVRQGLAGCGFSALTLLPARALLRVCSPVSTKDPRRF